jgi:hypothetical protein
LGFFERTGICADRTKASLIRYASFIAIPNYAAFRLDTRYLWHEFNFNPKIFADITIPDTKSYSSYNGKVSVINHISSFHQFLSTINATM